MESYLKYFYHCDVRVSMIPALYNVIFLSSMWDPYGSVSDLPVAVVNQDKAVTASGKTLSIGEDVVSSLKVNKICHLSAKKMLKWSGKG